MSQDPIFVTQPSLPPLDEFLPLLREIWESHRLTNGGPFHQRFEQALAAHLGVDHVSLFTNGTLALVTALQSLRITGEVITTPYSFVATAHSLLWNGIKPIFVDIEAESFGLNPTLIEAAITPQTTAILGVHTYGYPSQVEAIQRIADTYGLKVIYDACHAFGVRDSGGSLLRHGDLSVLSFHATKVFNTFEGGAIICPDLKTKQRIDNLKNFGFASETTVIATGINGKMSEFQAALGVLQLQHIETAIGKRLALDASYRQMLADLPGLRCPAAPSAAQWNASYFPVLVEPNARLNRDALYEFLLARGVHARRYFYPLISDFPMYRGLESAAPARLPVARQIADRVLCLPIYPDLLPAQQQHIVSLIHEALA